MTHTPLDRCPLCHSPDVKAYQVGWAVIFCQSCRLSLSRAMPLRELVEIWNRRGQGDLFGNDYANLLASVAETG